MSRCDQNMDADRRKELVSSSPLSVPSWPDVTDVKGLDLCPAVISHVSHTDTHMPTRVSTHAGVAFRLSLLPNDENIIFL